ncbi:hypothetical protein [Streptomyces sp. TLI_146]|nr:hypothetical protein [Streptomyces sp. TLI_146]
MNPVHTVRAGYVLRERTGADWQQKAFAVGGLPAVRDLITSQSLLA